MPWQAPATPPARTTQALPVVVRAVAPGDLPALDALLTHLSGRSRYRRWFTGAIDVHRAAAWAADPALHHAVGLVAVAPDGEIVGHAAMIAIDDARAEVCFEVAEPWRHQGVAGGLLGELARRGKQRGLQTLVAEVLTENADMLAVLREHGPTRGHRDGNVVELELLLR
jgi:GNAT superfamily N-acetyltransferase